MDRDIAIQLNTALGNIKTGLQTLASNTTPTASGSRSVSPDPAEDQRSAPAEDPEEPEAPEEEPEPEPVTKEKK